MVLEYNSVYDELAVFLASLSPRKVLAYKASPKAQERVNILLEKNKTAGLTVDENAEMERFMTVEHIVRLAKAKAMQALNSKL
jgi:chemotaxis signal transduction protein